MPFDDDIARKMGDLLLKGYCLLNAYCSVCSSALMRSREGEEICVGCRSSREVKESNQINIANGMEEDTKSSNISGVRGCDSGAIGEASSLTPSKRPHNLLGSDSFEKFNLSTEVWRNVSVPRMLRETVKYKLSWASSRLKVDSTSALSLLESCVNLLTITDTDLPEGSEYMITMLNLEKFVESEQKRLSECSDMAECNRICHTIYLTLKIMKNLDQSNVTKLNPL